LALDGDLVQKIKRKKLDEVEAEWNRRMESGAEGVSWFVEVARELRAAKAHAKLAELLALLADGLATEDRWEEAFDVLAEGVDLVPRNREFRNKVVEIVRARYVERADVEEVLAFFSLEGAEQPQRSFAELREWLRFEPGAGFYLFGRGLGKVAEVNLALQKIQLKFEKSQPLVVRRDEAKRLLTWIPREHFMMRRLDDPEGVRREARQDPGAFMKELFERFDRPLAANEIRECMSGVIEGGEWSAWWARAKSHRQVLPSPERKNAFVWSESSEAVERAILAEFASAPLAERLDLARRYAKRGGAVKAGIVRSLAEELARIAPAESADAVEVTLLLEELDGLPAPPPLSVDEVLQGPEAAQLITAVRDRRYREALYARARKIREQDWQEVHQAAFLVEPDFRLLSAIYDGLREAGFPEAAEKLVADAVLTPRRSPRAFVWVAKNVLVREELGPRATHGLLAKILEALDSPEFKDLRPHLREHFDPEGIAFQVFERSDREGVEQLLNLIDAASLEEHRKTEIRRAIFRRYPHIRKRGGREDVVYVTAESQAAKRAELERLVKVEIPENAEAIRIARSHGDLRENFEYHAARQKHELLNSRAAEIGEELRKTRIIDPAAVDPSKAGIGTRIALEPLAGGPARTITILGPWDSDPSRDVYSYQSELARGVLEKRVSDSIQLDGAQYRITAIEAWRAPEEAAQGRPE
jgi:transcription elongation GreA/GreB family factor